MSEEHKATSRGVNVLKALSDIRTGLFQQKTIADLGRFTVNELFKVGNGNTRIRFFETARDSHTKAIRFVLTESAGMPDAEALKGYIVDERSSTVLYDQPHFARRGAELKDMPDTGTWVKHLGVEERIIEEFPVTYNGEHRGLICIDHMARYRFSDEEIWLGMETAALLGHSIETIANREQAENLQKVTETMSSVSSYQKVVQTATDIVRKALGAAIVVYFELDPVRMVIVKQAFSSARALKGQIVEEEYVPGEFLTGKAWSDPEYRLCIDFVRTQAAEPGLVNSRYGDYYSTLIEEIDSAARVETVLYSSPRFGDRPGMFCAINRVDDMRLPFTQRHRDMLDNISLASASVLWNRMHEESIVALGDATSLFRSSPEEVHNNLAALLKAGNKYGIKSMGMVCRSPVSSALKGYAFVGDPFENLEFTRSLSWETDGLLKHILTLKKPEVIETSQFHHRSDIASFLYRRDVSHLYVVPFTGNVEAPGALLAVLGQGLIPLNSSKLVNDFWESHPAGLTMLSTLAALLGSALESALTSVRVSSTRDIYARIGHEIRMPIDVLGSQAYAACLEALKLAKLYAPSEVDRITCYQDEIEKRVSQIANTIADSFALGTTGSDATPYFLEPTALRDTLEGCVRLLHRDAQRRNAKIVLYDSAKRFRPIAVNKSGIERVFYNLLHNAIKYSHPRGPGMPIVVEVKGESTGKYIDIHISNWGMGIPDRDYANVFRGFYRSVVRDDRRAIPGMGLGLAIANRILTAHGGSIKVRSTPTLDDPERRKKLEGYQTVFTVRLPTDLRPGLLKTKEGNT